MKTLHIGRLYIDVGRINGEDNGWGIILPGPTMLPPFKWHRWWYVWAALKGVGFSVLWGRA